jgi:beta-glucosidase
MSDWTGTNSVAESIKAGCDLEMPGPAKWRGARALQALARNELSATDVSRAAANVLKLVKRTRGFGGDITEPEERSISNDETSNLIRTAGAEGIVLLKNDGDILPIRKAKTIALIGPNVKREVVGGGGSAALNPYYTVTPYDGICKAATSIGAKVVYAQGCDSTKWLKLASECCKTADGRPGVMLEYYQSQDFEGTPFSIQHKETTDLFLWDSAPKAILPAYSFKVKTSITPKIAGNHTFSFSSVGPGRLFLNGKLFIDNWDWTDEGEAMFEASQDVHKSIYLQAGNTVEILVESTNEIRPESKVTPGGPSHKYGGCRIGYEEDSGKEKLLPEAVHLGKTADLVVLCVGLDAEWESEGYDRQTMDLPKHGSQDRLIEAVLKANPNAVVVNQSGTPVTMPWADDAPAIIQAWYQGQEAGNSLADVLFGKLNPSGKLPTTFPKRLEDNPSHGNWPFSEDNKLEVVYQEGLFMGYRHYDAKEIEPLFPFGHGLSYTTYEYGKPSLSSSVLGEQDELVLSLSVTNSGSIGGQEIVQMYIRDIQSSLPRPKKELKAFKKVSLKPGETKMVEMRLDKHAVGFYNCEIGSWVAEQGKFEVLIGASSVDIRCVSLST